AYYGQHLPPLLLHLLYLSSQKFQPNLKSYDKTSKVCQWSLHMLRAYLDLVCTFAPD
ncbi:unnamed protein product, partial [Musa banksii]